MYSQFCVLTYSQYFNHKMKKIVIDLVTFKYENVVVD